MNKLEKLIAKLCPNGVEYKALGELCVRHHGTAITAGKIAELATPSGTVRVFAAGATKADVPMSAIPQKDIVRDPGIIVKSRGYIGFEFYEKPFTHKNELWSYTVNCSTINLRFVYYFLQMQAEILQSLARAKSVKLPQLSTRDTDELLIPVPPLPVQEEIVRMLDEMAGLIDELEQELVARKQQYEWYRDVIWRKNLPSDVRKVSLREAFDFYNGYTPSKSNAEFWTNGSVPWLRLEDIRTNGRVLSDSILQVTHQSIKGGLFPANSLMVSTSATIGEYALITVPAITNQRFVVIHPKPAYVQHIDTRFLLCVGHEIGSYCKKNVNQGNFASVDMEAFRKYEFPIPSLYVQKKIVEQLDGFDNLCNSMTDGLPGEIALRKQQYEYYRDRLLTFKRVG